MLLDKYFYKNDKFISKSLNFIPEQFNLECIHPLILLLENRKSRLNIEWIELYFNLLIKCKTCIPIKVKKQVILQL